MIASAPPQPGSVIGYAYLSADENAAGREEGRKDRPSLVLALAVQTPGWQYTASGPCGHPYAADRPG